MQTADTLGFLLGSWEVERTIEDHLSGTTGLFKGRATLAKPGAAGFTSNPDAARYEEAGELRFGAQFTRASRVLLFERLQGGGVMLHFADGKPFVDLDLRNGEWQSVHHCVDDLYEMATTVRSESVVEERWRVTGPSKDYAAVTTLTRVS